VAPGLKLRVLLAQALFSRPDVLLLDEPTNNLDIDSIRWLENVLNDYNATMVIISHDRHFLNQVCTHIADLDYQQVKIYPGNYDDFMLASVQARQRVEASNAKAKDRISDLQEFVRRFSANASKARQATSRKRLLEKIKIEEIRPSTRQNPYIRFEQAKKLYRGALNAEKISFRYPGTDVDVLRDVTFKVDATERVAIIGPNGIGKSTLMRLLAGEIRPLQQTQLGIGAGRCPFDEAERSDERPRHRHAADRKVLYGTLRLCAPQRFFRYLEFTHAVFLDAVGLLLHYLSISMVIRSP
jgi:ATPase subunit of ABC transporter with duplicated ATPase domains